MTLAELLAELAKLDREEVVRGIHDSAQNVYQVIFDRGHSTATTKAAAEKTRLEGELVAANTAKQEAETKYTQLKAENPDVAKIHEQYGAQITDLKEKNKETVKTLKAQFGSERHNRAVADLRTKLVSVGVDPDYAAVQAEKPEVQKRLRFDDAGNLEVLQEGKEIPLQPGDGKVPLDLLAAELKGRTPAKFVTATVDRGSQVDGGSGGGSGGKSKFDKIRAEVKERQDKKKADEIPLEQRLNLPPVVR